MNHYDGCQGFSTHFVHTIGPFCRRRGIGIGKRGVKLWGPPCLAKKHILNWSSSQLFFSFGEGNGNFLKDSKVTEFQMVLFGPLPYWDFVMETHIPSMPMK